MKRVPGVSASAATQSGSDRRSLARSKKPPEYVRLDTRAPVLMRCSGAPPAAACLGPRRPSGHRQSARRVSRAGSRTRTGRKPNQERFSAVFEDDQLMAVALSFQWIVLMGGACDDRAAGPD